MNKYNGVELSKDLFEPAIEGDKKILDVVEGESLSFFRDSFNRLMKNKVAVAALIIIVLIILLSIFVPFFTDSSTQWMKESSGGGAHYRNLPPKIPALSWIPWIGNNFDGIKDGVDMYADVHKNFWFGTNNVGQDLFAIVWEGTRVSLLIAFVAALIDLCFGMLYGGISGYYGGKTDNIMQRFIEIVSSIPSVVVATLFIIMFDGGILPIILALVLTSWIGMSRITRAQVIRTKSQEFVLASKTLGASNPRIIGKHLFPNIIGQLIVVMMFSIPSAIYFEAFLSYIGIGIQYPQLSLGSVINEGQSSLRYHPHLVLYPSLVLATLMLSFNLLSNGLRDALDPKMRGN